MPKQKLETKINKEKNTLQIGDVEISFHRTLRIPDDGKTYPLPASLGLFPIASIDDYRDTVPESWKEHGGVFIPMWQKEAMWMSYTTKDPHALKVAIGKIDALTGKPFSMTLNSKQTKKGLKQDYMVLPDQPWLDGIKTGKDQIKQFVAMPLGSGATVEGQITGEEKFGGIQIVAYKMKKEEIEKIKAKQIKFRQKQYDYYNVQTDYFCASLSAPSASLLASSQNIASEPKKIFRSHKMSAEMGLGVGGKMKQKIYEDTYGITSWDLNTNGRVYVHIVNSEMWEEITGEKLPDTPITKEAYASAGYPWFEIYDENQQDIKTSKKLANIKTVDQLEEIKTTKIKGGHHVS